MFKKILIAALLTSLLAHADVVDVTKQSEMTTKDGVGVSTSRRILLYKIFDLAIDQILLDQGKDVGSFRAALQAKFNNQFEPEKKKMITRFGDSPTAEQREDRDREIYLKEFEVKLSSSSLYNVVTTYSVDKFNSNVEQKKVAMTVNVKIDRQGLNQVYQSLVSSGVGPSGGSIAANLFIKVETNLENISWSDLGLANEMGLTEPLEKSWLAWFVKNKPANINNVSIYRSGKIASSDVLLELNSVISKNYQNKALHLFRFKLKVDCGLLSGAGNLVLGTCPPSEEIKEFTAINDNQIANFVANSLYRVPLGAFFEVQKMLYGVGRENVQFQVILENSVHFDQIQKVQKFLTTQTGELTQLMQMSANSAVIGVITYKKREDLFSQLLTMTQIPEVGTVKISARGEDLVITLN